MKHKYFTPIILLLIITSCVQRETAIDKESVSNGIDIQEINEKYSQILREDCYSRNDTLFYPLDFQYDSEIYEEILASLIIFESNIEIDITFIFEYLSKDEELFIKSTHSDSMIVRESINTMRYNEELHSLHKYIVFEMIPSDFTVYDYVMNDYYREDSIPEFENNNFYYLLRSVMSGDLDQKRFHHLMDLYIDWSEERGEKEKPDHFEYFKTIFPIYDWGPNDFIPAETKHSDSPADE